MKMISKEQYEKLCNTFNKILNEGIASIEMISIPWIHVVRAHPIFLSKYSFLFGKDRAWFFFCKQTIYQTLIKYYRLFQAIFTTKNVEQTKRVEASKLDYLFVSHLFSEDQLNRTEDFYFGKIPVELASHDKKVAIVYLPHFRSKQKGFAFVSNCLRVVLSRTLSFKEELYINRRLRHESILLKQKGRTGDRLFDAIVYESAREAKHDETRTVFRFYLQIGKILKQTNPRFVVFTYEGHSYERIICKAARDSNKEIKCFAYQHTGIFEHSNSLKQSIKGYDPDVILTTGTNDKAVLEANTKLRHIEKRILGSNRAEASLKIEIEKKQSACLVLPEGSLDECRMLFLFSIQCAISNPDVLFIWRLHPIISFNKLFKDTPELKIRPSNVILSANTLEDDLSIARWALYRGSTAILKALSFGVQPLYVKNSNEQLSIDPIYQMNFWKEKVDTCEDVSKIINSVCDDDLLMRNSKLALEYTRNQFSPFDYKQLLN